MDSTSFKNALGAIIGVAWGIFTNVQGLSEPDAFKQPRLISVGAGSIDYWLSNYGGAKSTFSTDSKEIFPWLVFNKNFHSIVKTTIPVGQLQVPECLPGRFVKMPW